jgi:hypothetical protein
MTKQLDMFDAPIGTATVAVLTPPNVTPLVGIPVRLPNQCGCGAVSASIVPGRGPHLAGLRCDFCSKHRGWVSREAHQFVAETVERFGRPTEPIEIRTAHRKEGDL